MIRQLMIAQFKTLTREPGVLFWVFGFPIVIAWVLGVAFSGDQVSNHQIGWVGSTERLSQTAGFVAEPGGFRLSGLQPKSEVLIIKVLSPEVALLQLKRGQISLIVTNSPTGLTTQMDLKNQEAKVSFLLLKSGLNPAPSDLTVEEVTSKGSRYVDFLVPGLMALGVMNSCIWGIGWATIELRMKKLLRRMIATPMPPAALLFAQFANRFLISLLELAVLLTFSYAYFDLTIQGSWLALLVLVFAGNLAFAGIAVLMASRTSSTTVGNGLVNLVTMPMMIMSGIFFSYQNFPSWSWPVLSHLPLTLLADGLRSVINEGAGLVDVMSSVAFLVATGLVFGLAGLKSFKWY